MDFRIWWTFQITVEKNGEGNAPYKIIKIIKITSNIEGAFMIGFHKCILLAILPNTFFSCKSVEQPQLNTEAMLCYIGVAVVENFWTSKEGDVIGKKLTRAMLTQFGKGKDERNS